MSVVPQMSFLHTSFSVTLLQRPRQHLSGKLTAITLQHLSVALQAFRSGCFLKKTSVREMGSKEALAKMVCLGTVQELHLDSRLYPVL